MSSGCWVVVVVSALMSEESGQLILRSNKIVIALRLCLIEKMMMYAINAFDFYTRSVSDVISHLNVDNALWT